MPAKSEKQAKFMRACAHDFKPKGKGVKCPSKKTARKFMSTTKHTESVSDASNESNTVPVVESHNKLKASLERLKSVLGEDKVVTVEQSLRKLKKKTFGTNIGKKSATGGTGDLPATEKEKRGVRKLSRTNVNVAKHGDMAAQQAAFEDDED